MPGLKFGKDIENRTGIGNVIDDNEDLSISDFLVVVDGLTIRKSAIR